MADNERPHANLDPISRTDKATKIEKMLRLHRKLQSLRILEIGTGSGILAALLAKINGVDGEVIAVDVVDQRQIKKGFEFQIVNSTVLPFGDASFDIVISNMVIEHVGNRIIQLHHLREIRRVLNTNGLAYIGAPNRWCLIESHYRLPFLSCLPKRFRVVYLRLTGKGSIYDCYPTSYKEFTLMLEEAHLSYADHIVTAMKLMRKSGSANWITRMLLKLPESLLQFLCPMSPTFIFLVKR